MQLRYTLIPGNGEIHQILKDDVSVADERLALTQRLSYRSGDAFNFFHSLCCQVAKCWQPPWNSPLCDVLMLGSSYLFVFLFFDFHICMEVLILAEPVKPRINPKSMLHSGLAFTASHTTHFQDILPSIFLDIPKIELMISLNPIFFGYYYTSFINLWH